MSYTTERAKVVNEHTDYGEGYGQTRFGVCIGDRIFMVGAEGYGYEPARSREERELCSAIVARWNAGLQSEALGEVSHG